MNDENSMKNAPPERKRPSAETFRKVKWIRRRRGMIGFFVFLCLVAAVLFFDYYWVLVSRTWKQPSRETEETAGAFLKMGDKEREETLARVRQLLDTGQVEKARQDILAYLKRESTAEGFYLAGLVYMRQGDVNSAYRNFKEAIHLKPDSYEAQQKLAEIYVTIGDLKSAQESASLLTKKSGMLSDGLLLESEIALADGKLDQAREKGQAAVDAKKGTAPERALIQLASLHARKGNRQQAEQIISQIDEKKLDATGLLTLTRYYQTMGKANDALTTLSNALARYPESPEVQYYYGQQLFSQGKYAEAIPHFQQAYPMMPQSRIAAYRVGQALLAAGKLKEAKQHIDQSLSLYPGDILALSLKVRYELLQLQPKAAMDTLKQTIALVPEAPRPHTLLAELYWAEGILSSAESYAQKALKLGETTLSPRIVLGDVFIRKGQYEKALEQYGKILERDPNHLNALSQTADSYVFLGATKKAEGLYERIISLYPNITMIKTKLELIRNLQKGPKGFLETAQTYYVKQPSEPRAVTGYVQALILNNRADDAIGVLKKAMNKAPGNVQYPILLGDLLLARKEIAGAREAYEKALQVAPKDLNILLNIGSRYAKNSLDKEAEGIYLKAQALYPGNILVINALAWFYTDTTGEIDKAKPLIDTLRVKGEGPTKRIP
jgi:tetratricopeptide (TPR) repeat protein